MLPTVRLPNSQLTTSRLAFGTSRLHYMDGQGRQRLLAEAADLGFVHFDTAPTYGDGMAERELGRFINGRRSRFVVATKYGIPPDRMFDAAPALAPALRGVRAVARKLGLYHSPRPPLTGVGLRQGVEQSLRRLRTEWIDVLLLHEPAPERIPSLDEIMNELVCLRERGLIRHFGLAGAWAGIATIRDANARIGEIIQTDESEWPANHVPDITYGAISRGPQSAFAASVDPRAVETRLTAALQRRPHGVVIVSTSKPTNLRLLAGIAARN